MSLELHKKLRDSIQPVVDKLDVELLFLPDGVHAEITQDFTSVCQSLETAAKAMSALAASNAKIISLLTEVVASQVPGDDEDDDSYPMDLSGKPIIG